LGTTLIEISGVSKGHCGCQGGFGTWFVCRFEWA